MALPSAFGNKLDSRFDMDNTSAGSTMSAENRSYGSSFPFDFGEDYPVTLPLRGTFVDFPVERGESLEKFLHTRQTRSAPSSQIETVDAITVPSVGAQLPARSSAQLPARSTVIPCTYKVQPMLSSP